MIWKPLEHQELGVEHLLKDDEAILFAGCGLGKTSMCYQAGIEKLLLGDAKGFLVVAPLRVSVMTWPLEADKWENFSWLRVVSLRTKEGLQAFEEGSAHFYTINYESLHKLKDLLKGKRFKSWPFDHVIWDELNYAKNPKSKRIRSARYYLDKCPGKWGLTGTPSPNTLLELFAQIRLIDLGKRLGRVYTHYRDRYFEATDFMGRSFAPKDWARKKIYEKLEDLCLTLRSEDWLDVPETLEEDVDLILPKEVQGVYGEMEEELISMLEDGEEISAANAAVLVNKLLQITSGAIYYNDDEARRWHTLHSLKVDRAKKFVAQAKGPVMVACSFKHEQERLAKAIPDAVRFDSVKGDRALFDLMKEWKRGNVPALIAHAASIGHGIDGFQENCQDVLWTSLPWSRALYDQLNARIIRMGQDEKTTITRLLVKDSIDYAIAEALRTKAEEQSALLAALAVMKKR